MPSRARPALAVRERPRHAAGKTRRANAFFKAALCCAAICLAGRSAPLYAYPPGFVCVTDVIPEAEIDMRYFGADNFVGAPIDSYRAPAAILTVEAAAALKRASECLRARGYGIKIFDAYRPASAVAHFVRWSEDESDIANKDIYYPNMSKADLFKKGFIARRSGHSRGSAVDLTIVDLNTGRDVGMGSDFDFFGEISHSNSRLATAEQSKNRKILRSAMEAAGFEALPTEWWHFSLKDEPHAREYFDFPVDYPPEAAEMRETLDAVCGGSDRVIVAVEGGQRHEAVIRAYERSGGVWTTRFETAGYFGGNGVRSDKTEGDGATPSGVYQFGQAFGTADDPGASTPYRKVASGDVWVDDPESKHYNTWASDITGSADWRSAERLDGFEGAYRHAVAINYNANPVVPGKGSAIFLHCSTGRPTDGCVAVPEPAMVFFLVFIEGGTKIAIAQDMTGITALAD
ncbi:MAG: L,D-transpeptidase family protein [Synergistaceae bacterium]|jgi:D-alanyl-D-alanine dipeptidase/L,D-peptidoglycan transpeptidase YkuD (ErfK/YbiS/YcfS/YnhG family)|nr:L,D-transpeptidase family protein [Synergistaceae bacterium]